MGLEGAIIGPIVLCCLIVVVRVYGTMLQPDPVTPDPGKHYAHAPACPGIYTLDIHILLCVIVEQFLSYKHFYDFNLLNCAFNDGNLKYKL